MPEGRSSLLGPAETQSIRTTPLWKLTALMPSISVTDILDVLCSRIVGTVRA